MPLKSSDFYRMSNEEGLHGTSQYVCWAQAAPAGVLVVAGGQQVAHRLHLLRRPPRTTRPWTTTSTSSGVAP
eukprot:3414910-Lingulodinium_polyedra.AAC.1